MRCPVAVVLCTAVLAAQNNDPNAPKKGGVAGIVVEKKSGDPIRKAIVILRVNQESGTGTTTDEAGKFALRDLDPGAYTLSVEHNGYVLARESEHKAVTVKASETTSDVKLVLLRTGAVSGHVVDADGEPIVGVSIQMLPAQKMKSGPPVRSYAVTDDRGEYRAFNIAPGEYQGMGLQAVVGDFNGDGKPDFAWGNGRSTGAIHTFLGNGDGTFRAQFIFNTRATW